MKMNKIIKKDRIMEDFESKTPEQQEGILAGTYELLGEIIKLALQDMFKPILAMEIDDSVSQAKVTRYIDAFTERNESILFFTKAELFKLTNLDARYLVERFLEQELESERYSHAYKQWLRYRLRAVQNGDTFEDLVTNNRNYKRAIKLYKKYKDNDMRGKYEKNLAKKKARLALEESV